MSDGFIENTGEPSLIEKAFMDEFIPEGGIPLAYFAVVGYFDEEGKQKYVAHGWGDAVPYTQMLGWVQVAQTELTMRTIAENRRRRD